MAYNLQSLAYSINQILQPHPKLSSVDELEKEKLETLLEKANTLQQILEKLALPTYNRLEMLQRQVIDLSHRAEDIVDSANVDRTLIALSTEGESSTVDSASVNQASLRHRAVPNSRKNKKLAGEPFLQKVIEEFDSLINKDLTIIYPSQQQTNVTKEFENLTVVDPTPESSTSVVGRPPRRASWLKRHFTSKGKGFTELPASVASSGPWLKRHFNSKGVTKDLASTRKVIEEFDSVINKDLTTVDSSQQQTTVIEELEDPIPESSSSVDERQTCRGLDKDMLKLRGQLTRRGSAHLKAIPIVGMGGIGKTTLAQILYHDPSIVKHYDCRAWVTISQEYEVGTLISTLLSCITKNQIGNLDQEDKDEPSVRLHKNLFNRRYLIVLDDIWSTTILDKLSKFFPDNINNSTIILTTRDQEVAAYANSSSFHNMQLLGPVDSWEIFRGKVFGEKEDHPELEKLGRKIAENCKGLPLAISVISGLLLKCDNADFWEHVADDISPAVALDEQFSKILSLSYDHLPHHLRPCLLYLGAFPKGGEIRVSRIKRLWAADSFLKPIEDKTLEESAEQYLEDLENRNLLVVRERKSCGKVKNYGMHDLLNDLCIRRAEQEDFLVCSKIGHVMKAIDKSIEAPSLRRVFLNNRRLKKEISKPIVSELLSTSKLVRVLDASAIRFDDHFPEVILQLCNIRYLSLNCYLLLPLLSRLWNLETLILFPDQYIEFDIPDEIWELGKLKHFKIIQGVGMVIMHSALETLQSLSFVMTRMRVANFIERIPKIKELGLDLDYRTEDIDMCSLHNLENLKIQHFPNLSIRLPSSVSKLTLFKCDKMNGNLMKVIGELPHLEVLKIQDCEWKDLGGEKEWKTYEAGFPSLHFLQFGIFSLKQWNIEDETHFPVLKHLRVRDCVDLEEIPSCIGDIPTLEIIEIDRCCESVVESGRRIWKEQRDMSNDALQLRIRDYYYSGGSWGREWVYL